MEAINGNDMTQDDFTRSLNEITRLQLDEDINGTDNSKEIARLKELIEYEEEDEE